jgi:hypothetical protein
VTDRKIDKQTNVYKDRLTGGHLFKWMNRQRTDREKYIQTGWQKDNIYEETTHWFQDGLGKMLLKNFVRNLLMFVIK